MHFCCSRLPLSTWRPQVTQKHKSARSSKTEIVGANPRAKFVVYFFLSFPTQKFPSLYDNLKGSKNSFFEKMFSLITSNVRNWYPMCYLALKASIWCQHCSLGASEPKIYNFLHFQQPFWNTRWPPNLVFSAFTYLGSDRLSFGAKIVFLSAPEPKI
jgi:hypothetical protein